MRCMPVLAGNGSLSLSTLFEREGRGDPGNAVRNSILEGDAPVAIRGNEVEGIVYGAEGNGR